MPAVTNRNVPARFSPCSSAISMAGGLRSSLRSEWRDLPEEGAGKDDSSSADPRASPLLSRHGGNAQSGRERSAEIRSKRLLSLSRLRGPGERVCPGAMSGMRPRFGCRVLVKGAGRLPFLCRPAHGGYRGAPGGPRFPPGSRPAVGPFPSVGGAVHPGAGREIVDRRAPDFHGRSFSPPSSAGGRVTRSRVGSREFSVSAGP